MPLFPQRVSLPSQLARKQRRAIDGQAKPVISQLSRKSIVPELLRKRKEASLSLTSSEMSA
jgi:hypothetical protein